MYLIMHYYKQNPAFRCTLNQQCGNDREGNVNVQILLSETERALFDEKKDRNMYYNKPQRQDTGKQ